HDNEVAILQNLSQRKNQHPCNQIPIITKSREALIKAAKLFKECNPSKFEGGKKKAKRRENQRLHILYNNNNIQINKTKIMDIYIYICMMQHAYFKRKERKSNEEE
ncbi:hypothetical protein PanWU01x14_077710, partial [Parasponia andersonii]